MPSNPVFNKFDKDLSQGRYAGFDRPQYGQYASQQEQAQSMYGGQLPYQGYGQTATGAPGYGAGYGQGGSPAYGGPGGAYSQASTSTRSMTMDDVITKTLALFGVVLVTGAIGWFVAAQNQSTGMTLWMSGMFGGLIIGFVIAFKKTVSVPLILTYAVLEGLFLGACSQFFNNVWPGVVAQAVLATLCVFAGMLAGYKFGIIKVTERSRKIFMFLLFGYMLFALVNVVLLLTGVLDGFGVGGTSTLGIVISLFAVALASYSLAVDFDSIQRGVQAGLPEKYSWLMAHGLIVSVVWLYIEMLRLFARLQQRN